jgi:hypothetical protein
VATQSEHAIETYKSLIQIAVEGLKILLLINGGAVVAILAYLGQSPEGARLAQHSMLPLGSFVAGLFFSVLAFAGAYATQFALYNETVGHVPSRGQHMQYLRSTVVVVVLSLVAFAVGAFSSVCLLSNKSTAPTTQTKSQ